MRSFSLGYTSYFPNMYGYAITTGNTQQSNPYDTAGRIYGQVYLGPAFNVAIVSSTNATPIVITVGAAALTGVLIQGDGFVVSGHTVNTAANNTPSNPIWKAGATTATTVTLLTPAGANSVGNGVGGATGQITTFSRFGRSAFYWVRKKKGGALIPTIGQVNGT